MERDLLEKTSGTSASIPQRAAFLTLIELLNITHKNILSRFTHHRPFSHGWTYPSRTCDFAITPEIFYAMKQIREKKYMIYIYIYNIYTYMQDVRINTTENWSGNSWPIKEQKIINRVC